MQRITLLSGCFIALVSFAFAQPTSTLSLENFTDQSAQELRQLRSQVDEAARGAPQVAQTQFASVYDALATADEALARLKTAPMMDVDQRRTEFEKSRTHAVKAWNDFRFAHPNEQASQVHSRE